MDGWVEGKGSSERAHGTKRAKGTKRYSGTLRGTDRRSCNSAVLLADRRTHGFGTYTCCKLGRAGVGQCTDTLVKGQVQRELETTDPGFGLEIIITRATPPAHHAHHAHDCLDLVLDCFTCCLCVVQWPRPALPSTLTPSLASSKAEQRRFNAC
jgi:hypothetical protein